MVLTDCFPTIHNCMLLLEQETLPFTEHLVFLPVLVGSSFYLRLKVLNFVFFLRACVRVRMILFLNDFLRVSTLSFSLIDSYLKEYYCFPKHGAFHKDKQR